MATKKINQLEEEIRDLEHTNLLLRYSLEDSKEFSIGLIIGIIIVFIIGIIIVFIAFIWVLWMIPFEEDRFNEDVYDNCLKKIAIKECQERGLVYKFYKSDFSKKKFSCIEDRKRKYEEFDFYDSEIAKCKLEAK